MHVQLRRARLAALAAQVGAGAGTGVGGDRAAEIASIRSYRLREPVSRRTYTVVRVETRAGVVGYGECGVAADFASANLTGQPVTAYETIRRRLASAPEVEAGVSIALLDILGKLSKAPLHQVLGGPTRNKARALAVLEGDGGDALAASMRRARDAGYRAFSVMAPAPAARNQGQAFVQQTRRRLEALRAEAGDGADFVLDGAGALTPGDASSLAAALERFHLLWFDEPCRLTNLNAIRKISSESVTPLGFGRDVHEASVFQDLLREGTIDILRPNLARSGVSSIRRMAAMAETYYTAVAPYHNGGPIGTAAALHLAASLPNFFIQQIPLPSAEEDRRMRAELTGGTVEIVKDGFAQLPAGPGLGITVNEKVLEKYVERAA